MGWITQRKFAQIIIIDFIETTEGQTTKWIEYWQMSSLIDFSHSCIVMIWMHKGINKKWKIVYGAFLVKINKTKNIVQLIGDGPETDMCYVVTHCPPSSSPRKCWMLPTVKFQALNVML